MLMYENKQCVV